MNGNAAYWMSTAHYKPEVSGHYHVSIEMNHYPRPVPGIAEYDRVSDTWRVGDSLTVNKLRPEMNPKVAHFLQELSTVA